MSTPAITTNLFSAQKEDTKRNPNKLNDQTIEANTAKPLSKWQHHFFCYASGIRSASEKLEAMQQEGRKQQENMLQELLKTGSESAYGLSHYFNACHSIRDFQQKVPIVSYDTLMPWLTQLESQQGPVLSNNRLLYFRSSRHSDGRQRLLPISQKQFRYEVDIYKAWLYQRQLEYGHLLQGPIYWQSSCDLYPVHEQTSKQTQNHFQWIIQQLSYNERYALKHWLKQQPLMLKQLEKDPLLPEKKGAWSHEVVLSLLNEEKLQGLVIANPWQIHTLWQYIQEHLPKLLSKLPEHRQQSIQKNMEEQGAFTSSCIWPQMRWLATYQHGPYRSASIALLHTLPGLHLKSPPLLFPECILTAPSHTPSRQIIAHTGSPLALAGQFLEFMDEDNHKARPLLAHELRLGAYYTPIISNPSGLYRYQLDHIVRCVGYHKSGMPMITAVDQKQNTNMLLDEQLEPHHVASALEETWQTLGFIHDFALCVPQRSQNIHTYLLYTESSLSSEALKQIEFALEQIFCRHHRYWQARAQGKLAALKIVKVKDGWQTYMNTLHQQGIPSNKILCTFLDTRTMWHDIFRLKVYD